MKKFVIHYQYYGLTDLELKHLYVLVDENGNKLKSINYRMDLDHDGVIWLFEDPEIVFVQKCPNRYGGLTWLNTVPKELIAAFRTFEPLSDSDIQFNRKIIVEKQKAIKKAEIKNEAENIKKGWQ